MDGREEANALRGTILGIHRLYLVLDSEEAKRYAQGWDDWKSTGGPDTEDAAVAATTLFLANRQLHNSKTKRENEREFVQPLRALERTLEQVAPFLASRPCWSEAGSKALRGGWDMRKSFPLFLEEVKGARHSFELTVYNFSVKDLESRKKRSLKAIKELGLQHGIKLQPLAKILRNLAYPHLKEIEEETIRSELRRA